MQTPVIDLWLISIITSYHCMGLYFGSLDKQTVFISVCGYISVSYLMLIIICILVRLYINYSITKILIVLSLLHICDYHINIYSFIEVFIYKNYVIYTLNFRAVIGILQCAYLLILSFILSIRYSQEKIDISKPQLIYKNLDDKDFGDVYRERRDQGHRDQGHRDQGHRDQGHRDQGHRDQEHINSRSTSNSTSISISIEEICT